MEYLVLVAVWLLVWLLVGLIIRATVSTVWLVGWLRFGGFRGLVVSAVAAAITAAISTAVSSVSGIARFSFFCLFDADILHGNQITEDLISSLLPGAQFAAVGQRIVSQGQVDKFGAK